MIRSSLLISVAVLLLSACPPAATPDAGPDDKEKVDPATQTLVIFYGDADEETVFKRTLDFAGETASEVALTGVGFPRGMHLDESTIYVADSNNDTIWQIPTAGGTGDSITGAQNAYAVTKHLSKVFWVQNEGSLLSLVRKSNRDGTNKENVAELTGPIDILTDGEFLYVSTVRLLENMVDTQGEILQISFDGTEVNVFFDITANLGDGFRAGAMQLDGGTLYVAQQNGGKVIAIDMQSKAFETAFEEDGVRIQGLHIFGNRIFFSDWEAEAIREYNMKTEQLRTWVDGVARPMDVFVTTP